MGRIFTPSLLLVLDGLGIPQSTMEELVRVSDKMLASAEDKSPLFLTERPRGEMRNWFMWTAGMLELFERLAALRQATLLQVLCDAMARRESLTIAFSARALIEAAAAVVYEWRSLSAMMGPEMAYWRPREEAVARLERLMLGGRFDWDGFGKMSTEKRALFVERFANDDQAMPEHLAANVLTMLSALRSDIAGRAPDAAGVVHCAYAYLSDMCHPSRGSNHLFVAEREGRLALRLDSYAGYSWLLVREVVPAIMLAIQASERSLESICACRMACIAAGASDS